MLKGAFGSFFVTDKHVTRSYKFKIQHNVFFKCYIVYAKNNMFTDIPYIKHVYAR